MIENGLFNYKSYREFSDDDFNEESFNKSYCGSYNDEIDEDVLKVRQLVNKINIVCDNDLNALTPDKRASKVIIKFKEDKEETLEKTTYFPLGEKENPLSKDDILLKFKLLNPKFNMNKLQIIKHMENCSFYEVLNELGLLD